MRGSERLIGREVRRVAATGSTMDDVAQASREGAAEGLVVSADAQTSGRGRHQREWASEAGKDVLASVLFRPRPAIAGEIGMLLALSIAEVVEVVCGCDVRLKWPNDVRVDGEKVAGILLESEQGPSGLAVVAGIGLNVNSQMRGVSPDGVAAVSMSELADRELNRDEVLEELLGRIDGYYAEVRAGGTVAPAWRSRLETIGQRVTVTFVRGDGAESSVAGVAEDVDESGRLIVRDENGRAWPVAAGEVTLRE